MNKRYDITKAARSRLDMYIPHVVGDLVSVNVSRVPLAYNEYEIPDYKTILNSKVVKFKDKLKHMFKKDFGDLVMVDRDEVDRSRFNEFDPEPGTRHSGPDKYIADYIEYSGKMKLYDKNYTGGGKSWYHSSIQAELRFILYDLFDGKVLLLLNIGTKGHWDGRYIFSKKHLGKKDIESMKKWQEYFNK